MAMAAGQIESLFLERARYYLRVEDWTKLRATMDSRLTAADR
jgi:hypothetical protein